MISELKSMRHSSASFASSATAAARRLTSVERADASATVESEAQLGRELRLQEQHIVQSESTHVPMLAATQGQSIESSDAVKRARGPPRVRRRREPRLWSPSSIGHPVVDDHVATEHRCARNFVVAALGRHRIQRLKQARHAHARAQKEKPPDRERTLRIDSST